jgi:AraC-like DNA-binding protein
MSRKRHTPADEPHFLIRTYAAEYRSGFTLDPHSHDWPQLIYAQTGVMHVWTSHGSWIVPPRWAVWTPAAVAHGIRFTGAASLRTLYFRPNSDVHSNSTGLIRVSSLLRELILRAIELQFLDAREPVHVAMAKLIHGELRTDSTPPLDLPLPTDPLLRRIADHLSENPSDHASHAGIAKRFGIGVRTLERGFAGETGMALGHWRRQARFLYALRLLGGGAAVKQAALDSGYRSPSAFIAAFRAVFQNTPGRYFQS